NASGTTDSIYVLNTNGDIRTYSLTLPSVDIIGPPFWTTEGGTHVLYFGTSDGKVYKRIDTGAALVVPPSPWNTEYSDSSALLAVTTPVISDGTNVYFGGQ